MRAMASMAFSRFVMSGSSSSARLRSSAMCGTEVVVTPLQLPSLAGEADGIEGRVDL